MEKSKKIIIEKVLSKNPESIEPCLVKFGNGILNNADDITGELYRNNSEKHQLLRKRRLLKVFSNRLTYIGSNYGDESFSQDKEQIFIGLLDKKTSKMTLVEASTFLLHPNLSNGNEELPRKSDLSYNEQRRELSHSFGSKKSRVIFKKREEKKVNLDDMGDVLKSALDKVNTDDVDLKNMKVTDNFEYLLPPCNREANNVNAVYPLENIITDDELLLFNEMAIEYLEAEELPEVRSRLLEDRLIAHIIILALISNNYEISWTALSSSLQIKKDRLESIMQVVGATLHRDSGIIMLKLPLTKLAVSKGQKRSRK